MGRGRLLVFVAGALALVPVPLLRWLGGRGIESVTSADREQRTRDAVDAFAVRLEIELKRVLDAPRSAPQLALGDPERARVADEGAGGCAAADSEFAAARARLASGDADDALAVLDVLAPRLRMPSGDDMRTGAADARLLALLLAREAFRTLKHDELAERSAVLVAEIPVAALSASAQRRRTIEQLDDPQARADAAAAWTSEVEDRATDLCELAWLAGACADDASRARATAIASRERTIAAIELNLADSPPQTLALLPIGGSSYVVSTDRRRAVQVDAVSLAREAGAASGGDAVVPRRLRNRTIDVDLGRDDIALRLPRAELFSGVDPRRALDVGLAIYAALAIGLMFVLWRAQSRAETLAATRADLIAQITHELRTPLAVLRMYGETLAAGRVPQGAHAEYVATMSAEAARLGLLVDRVARAAREVGGERIDAELPASCDASVVVRALVATYARATEQAGGRVDLDDAGGVTAGIDAEDLRLIVDVLLDNALEYGRVDGAPPRIDVAVANEHGHCTIAVRDRGPGIPPAERASLFERFARGSSGIRSSHRGAGMGLYLARRAARAAGGDVALEFPADGGTRAIVTLPMESRA